MGLEFRRGMVEDIVSLQELGLSAYGQHRSALTAENWEKFSAFLTTPDSYSNLLRMSTCFLCEVDQRIVGMAFIVSKGHPTDLFEADWSYIRMVGVDPGFSGRGIAKRLTQLCLEHAGRTGERYVALHTSEFMDAARHVYEGFGFKAVRSLMRYGAQYWIYLLELNCTPHDRLSH